MARKGEGRDTLAEALEGEYPDAFIFEKPGQTLVGKVKGFSKGFSKFGAHLVVTVQREDDGEIVSVHALHTSLRNQIAEADPKPGDRIGVKYVGERTSEKGKRKGTTYKEFRVRVDSPNRSAQDVLRSIGLAEEDEDDMPF